MVKVNNISRDDQAFTRDKSTEPFKQFYNPDQSIHRFEKPREYVRAINAAKMDDIHAKPFLDDLSGHMDTPQVIALHSKNMGYLLTGACDGEIKLWNVPSRRAVQSIKAHNSFVNGIVVDPEGEYFYSCGTDRYLKKWKLDTKTLEPEKSPVANYITDNGLLCMDHHYKQNLLVTAGDVITVWDTTRLIPTQSFDLQMLHTMETVFAVKYNKVECDIVAYCCRDRSVGLYDVRSGEVVRRLVMARKSNAVCWNPMQPFHFSLANEDSNAYTFDMRKLGDGPIMMHSGHTNAVMDIDYSPTGSEFVTGSYDKTIRIFKTDTTNYKSRELYHTRRMQRIFSVKFSSDSRFVFSGSDDHAVRIWKTNRSEPLRNMSIKEEKTLQYNKKLVERYKHMEEVRRIDQRRHVPKLVLKDAKILQDKREASDRRQRNQEKYAMKKGSKIEKPVAMKKHFLREEE
ncbi:DDB1- and CUL4-associated factor [Acrasis kona]|uniref:DDB1- and CUL4-associated factor 13 n=1 Tax=Acrasis kona TaxID=1008807 RepID=A0AAW2YRV0_9EUKA